MREIKVADFWYSRTQQWLYLKEGGRCVPFSSATQDGGEVSTEDHNYMRYVWNDDLGG